MARICWAISDGESATERFWQTTQRSSVAISRVRSSRSGALAAPIDGIVRTNRAYTSNKIRRNIASPNGLVVAFAFLGARDAFRGFFDFAQDKRGADAADVLVGDPALRIDEKAFGNSPGAVVNSDVSGLVFAIGIGY